MYNLTLRLLKFLSSFFLPLLSSFNPFTFLCQFIIRLKDLDLNSLPVKRYKKEEKRFFLVDIPQLPVNNFQNQLEIAGRIIRLSLPALFLELVEVWDFLTGSSQETYLSVFIFRELTDSQLMLSGKFCFYVV